MAMTDTALSLLQGGGLLQPMFLVGGILAVLAATILLLAALQAAGAGRPLLFLLRLAVGALLLAAGAGIWALAWGIQGYRALLHEEVAAVIELVPLGEQRVEARLKLADGSERRYELAGDEVYVDAQILKWKPAVNALGLHTAYRLDRIAGRYRSVEQEQSAPHTVHALAAPQPLDLFDLRSRHPMLDPLVDAQYGSATFVPAAPPRRIEVRVSASGLLAREAQAAEQ